MERHPRLLCAVVELDIQRRHMSLKGKSWRGLVGAEGIIDRAVLIAHSELSADFDVGVLWKIFRDPG